MGYRIHDQLELSLFFGDVEYPLSEINILNFLHMGSSVRFLSPTIHFSISDASYVLSKANLLYDAMPIRVVLRYGESDEVVYNFRLNNFKQSIVGSVPTYEIDGYVGSTRYWLERRSAPARGTSAAVIEEIANYCGLEEVEVHETSDAQLWLPQNRTNAQWMKAIAEHGWSSDDSFMSLAMNLDASVRYVDLNRALNPVQNFVFGEFRKGYIQVVSHTPGSGAGFNNQMSGYRSVLRNQQATEAAAQEVVDTLPFDPDSSRPLYNLDVRRDIVGGTQRFSPIGFGNTHKNYDKAKYQNIRYGNLMNYSEQLLLHIPSQRNIFDCINFAVDNAEGTMTDAASSGNYVIASKAILVQGGTYREKLECFRHGLNEE